MGELADYYAALDHAHRLIDPEVYLEIGVHEGHSFRFAVAGTAIGVDPTMNLKFEVSGTARMFHETSDEFFAHHATAAFASGPIELAFLDGLHHWDQTLRDFASTERHSHDRGAVLIHDCLPLDAETSTRDRQTVVWSGDVWKTILWLVRHRPDLEVTTLDVAPTGLAVVTGLDPTASPVAAALDDDLWQLDYDDIADSLTELLNVVPGTVEALEAALSAR